MVTRLANNASEATGITTRFMATTFCGILACPNQRNIVEHHCDAPSAPCRTHFLQRSGAPLHGHDSALCCQCSWRIFPFCFRRQPVAPPTVGGIQTPQKFLYVLPQETVSTGRVGTAWNWLGLFPITVCHCPCVTSYLPRYND